MTQVKLYDTTLRDGTQAEEINLHIDDKIKIALKLDALGIQYIEGGWPGSNPTDKAFFTEIGSYQLQHATICAFGSTHHPSNSPESDGNCKTLIESKAPVLTIVGKTWDIHAQQALRVSLDRNLELIRDTVAYLKPKCKEVFFDAEHLFDGFKANPEYTLATLKTAHEAGADALVLCDTNGGNLPHEITAIIDAIKKELPEAELGIHVHNDCELAVGNTIEAVRHGVSHVQGTINGYGERCGNANLCSIIPIIELKTDKTCLPPGKLPLLTSTASYVAEVANVPLFNRQPIVGRSAFAHKGGIHVSAINRNSQLYEHIEPKSVGNRQRVLLSELAGRANIVSMAQRYGFYMEKDEPVVKGLLAELKKKSALGYDYSAAEASVELLLLRKLARRGVRDFFKLVRLTINDSKLGKGEPITEASVIVEVEGVEEHTAAIGNGPVNALDNALRKALRPFYPRLHEVRLLDFKVRVLNTTDEFSGTGSVVRVLIESGDSQSRWVTVGVSPDVIEASWQALSDSIIYKLYKDEQEKRTHNDKKLQND